MTYTTPVSVAYVERSSGRVFSIMSAPDLAGFDPGDEQTMAVLTDYAGQLPALWDGKAVVRIPDKPSDFHSWSWEHKAWLQDLEAARAAKHEEVKRRRDSEEGGLFSWRGHTLQADKERVNGAVTGALIARGAGVPYTDEWTLADNSVIQVTGDDIIDMGLTLLTHVSACHAKSRALRARIDAATTVEELSAISWS